MLVAAKAIARAVIVAVVAGAIGSAQIIDRVLAVVDGSPITLSDVNAAVTFGLVAAPRQADGDRAALDAVIDRRLQLIEVNRYLPPEPTAEAIDARLAEIRQRFASVDAFQAALQETGMSAIDLRAAVRDSLRISSYLGQRFRAGYQPGEDEVLAYYRSHQPDFVRGGAVRPFAEVRDEARQRLIESRTDTLIHDWVATLRRRVDVTLLAK
jgi:parvulin-like peptidyl-prolyl isomerase